MPLTPEQIDELLSLGRKPSKTPQEKLQEVTRKRFSRITVHWPVVHNSKYYRYVEMTHRCASRGCGGPSNELVEGIPYCGAHAIFALVTIIERLETKLNVSVPNITG